MINIIVRGGDLMINIIVTVFHVHFSGVAI